jgi:hypothetical protein
VDAVKLQEERKAKGEQSHRALWAENCTVFTLQKMKSDWRILSKELMVILILSSLLCLENTTREDGGQG